MPEREHEAEPESVKVDESNDSQEINESQS